MAPRAPPRSEPPSSNTPCRGLLTYCTLKALEQMNFQGSYYELWQRAQAVLDQELRPFLHEPQHIQLTFADTADPTMREVFAPVDEAEARAFRKRIELFGSLAVEGADGGDSPSCCATGGRVIPCSLLNYHRPPSYQPKVTVSQESDHVRISPGSNKGACPGAPGCALM